MKHAAKIDNASIVAKAKSLLASYGPADHDRIVDDGALKRLLRELAIHDFIDVVDSTKAGDGEARTIAAYRLWISLAKDNPRLFAAWYNLGVQLNTAGQTAEAATAFRTALTLKGDLAPAAINAGLCHETLDDAEGALRIWQEAIQSDDYRTKLLNQCARLLANLKRYDEAEQKLLASLLTNPHQHAAIDHLVYVRMRACSWPIFSNIHGVDQNKMFDAAGSLSLLALTDDINIHKKTNKGYIDNNFCENMPRLSPVSGYRHRKLKIGYLSSDFCLHPMAYLVADLFEQHDRREFEIYGYCSTKEDGSDVRRRVLASFDKVSLVKDMTDEAVARLIRADEIDILVDLNGLTLGTRLQVLRWRPAPVQMTYLGYNGAMPMDEIDYIIADRYVIPPHLEESHQPRPLYLPSCYQANDRKLPLAPGQTRLDAGLPDDKFVFCCFSNNYKISEDLFDAWIAILRRADDAVLWIYADNDASHRNMLARFTASGLDPRRLFFAARAEPPVYRARLALADVFLDTFPYNAGATASDALRVGLPIVTMAGRSFASRMAGSLLTAIGLSEGIVDSLDAYVDLAVSLAVDAVRYGKFRAAVAPGAWEKTIGDTIEFTKQFEAALASVAVTASPRIAVLDADEAPRESGGMAFSSSGFGLADRPLFEMEAV